MGAFLGESGQIIAVLAQLGKHNVQGNEKNALESSLFILSWWKR